MDIRKYLKFRPIAEAGRPWFWDMLARAFSDLGNAKKRALGFKHARQFYESRIWERYEEAVGEMASAPNKHALETGNWLYMPLPEGQTVLENVGRPLVFAFGSPCVDGIDKNLVIAEAANDGQIVKFKLKVVYE